MARPIERFETRSGEWAWRVTRHGEVKALLADERLGMPHTMPARALAGPRGTGITRRAAAGGQFEYGVHTTWRKTMNKVFSARAFDSMVPVIRSVATALVSELISDGPPADVHDRYSVPLTSQVMCALLSVPADDIPCFREWAGDGEEGAGAPSDDGMGLLSSYAKQLIAQRREKPADDAVSALIRAGKGSEKVHEIRSVGLLSGMLAFGWQTPASIIDSGVALLLAHPAQRQLLGERPALIPRAADEVLRLTRPPLAIEGGVHRHAHADVEVGEVTIRTGDMVILDLMAANRDSEVFPDPDRFDISRDPNPHLAFGYAFYMCNFSRLARSEIGIGLASLLGGIPGLCVAAQADMPVPVSPRKESTGKLTVAW